MMNEPWSGHTPAPSYEPRPWWTPRQVAETLQVTTRTVARWIASGALRAHRFGGSVRIADADLQEFIAKGRKA